MTVMAAEPWEVSAELKELVTWGGSLGARQASALGAGACRHGRAFIRSHFKAQIVTR